MIRNVFKKWIGSTNKIDEDEDPFNEDQLIKSDTNILLEYEEERKT